MITCCLIPLRRGLNPLRVAFNEERKSFVISVILESAAENVVVRWLRGHDSEAEWWPSYEEVAVILGAIRVLDEMNRDLPSWRGKTAEEIGRMVIARFSHLRPFETARAEEIGSAVLRALET